MTEEFKSSGYVVIRGLLDQPKIDFVRACMDISRREDEMQERKSFYVHDAVDQYSPVFGELLLRECRPTFERVVGAELEEACAYWRIYFEGAKLLAHTDRAACEISASITIASAANAANWPLMVENLQGETLAIAMRPGDAVVYEGHMIKHWREPLTAPSHHQMFFHYVRKGGDYTANKYDGRDHVLTQKVHRKL